MKKFLFLLMSAVLLCGAAEANHGVHCGKCKGCECHAEHKMKKNQGKFIDSSAQPVSLAVVESLPDGAYVTVIGYLTKRLGNMEYNFTDGMDNMAVEIKNKRWKGQRVTPKDKVILRGKVDKGATETMIDVKSVKIID